MSMVMILSNGLASAGPAGVITRNDRKRSLGNAIDDVGDAAKNILGTDSDRDYRYIGGYRVKRSLSQLGNDVANLAEDILGGDSDRRYIRYKRGIAETAGNIIRGVFGDDREPVYVIPDERIIYRKKRGLIGTLGDVVDGLPLVGGLLG